MPHYTTENIHKQTVWITPDFTFICSNKYFCILITRRANYPLLPPPQSVVAMESFGKLSFNLNAMTREISIKEAKPDIKIGDISVFLYNHPEWLRFPWKQVLYSAIRLPTNQLEEIINHISPGQVKLTGLRATAKVSWKTQIWPCVTMMYFWCHNNEYLVWLWYISYH